MAQPDDLSRREITVTGDVSGAFATIVRTELREFLERSLPPSRFRLAVSGGGSGQAVLERLATSEEIDWERLAVYLVDERCVPESSPDANIGLVRTALGPHLDAVELHPMSCEFGPEAYEAEIREAGGLDLTQLGFGPDGHTASLFPGSSALEAPADRLVVRNIDPLGNNPHERLTLTYGGIAQSRLVVVTVMGESKRDALAAVLAGEALPAGRVVAPRVIWLVGTEVAAGLDLTDSAR